MPNQEKVPQIQQMAHNTQVLHMDCHQLVIQLKIQPAQKYQMRLLVKLQKYTRTYFFFTNLYTSQLLLQSKAKKKLIHD